MSIPFSVVADQEQIPAISGLTPTLAWKGANAINARFLGGKYVSFEEAMKTIGGERNATA